MTGEGEKYNCAMCKGIFLKGQPDEDAIAETHENFGNIKQEDCDIVCEDCYEKVFPHFPEMIQNEKLKHNIRG